MNCRTLLLQLARLARSFALARAGRSSAARIAMMAMTTSNSTSVNAVKQCAFERGPGRGLLTFWRMNCDAQGLRDAITKVPSCKARFAVSGACATSAFRYKQRGHVENPACLV